MKNARNFFEHSLTLFSEIAILVGCIIWYFQTKEIEPLIGMIASFTAVCLSVFFRTTKSTEEVPNPNDAFINKSKNVVNQATITTGDGNFQVGDNTNLNNK